MSLLRPYTQDGIPRYGFMYWCPGCDEPHSVSIKGPNSIDKGPWQWNGSQERPTFTPSVLVHSQGSLPTCHCYITEGSIRFLGDCGHRLAGQTVPMEDWDAWAGP